jgi:hypothetical protein
MTNPSNTLGDEITQWVIAYLIILGVIASSLFFVFATVWISSRPHSSEVEFRDCTITKVHDGIKKQCVMSATGSLICTNEIEEEFNISCAPQEK